ncbi:hypothetical protein PI125_g26032 [Phytophthora idaei]|nr:hypothetical protein PI125_g26032 [Phytophthora idaei]KAG3123011.1 hypothetical protein PI126_g23891 [Phytophthora idaei]
MSTHGWSGEGHGDDMGEGLEDGLPHWRRRRPVSPRSTRKKKKRALRTKPAEKSKKVFRLERAKVVRWNEERFARLAREREATRRKRHEAKKAVCLALRHHHRGL